MRLRSTPKSIARCEISALAVAECVLSVAIYVAIAHFTQSFLHMAIAVACAPLFLLRTKYSIRLGLIAWKRVINAIQTESEYLVIIIVIPLMVVALIVRAGATFYGLLKHARATISSIPLNWRRQSLCADFFSIPELIPGESRYGRAELTFKQVMEGFYEIPSEMALSKKDGIIASIVFTVVFILGYVPSIIFRATFKATCLAYFPLLWVARSANVKGRSLKWKLERFTKGELEKTRRKFAVLVLTVAGAKVAFLQGWVEREFVDTRLGSVQLADIILFQWPWWHYALIGEAVLTITLFYFSEWSLSLLDDLRHMHRKLVISFVSGASFVRSSLGTATALFFFVFALSVLLRAAGVGDSWLPTL